MSPVAAWAQVGGSCGRPHGGLHSDGLGLESSGRLPHSHVCPHLPGGGWSWEDPHSLGTWRGSLISVWPVCGVFPAWLWPDEPDFLCHGTGSNARVLGKSDLGGVSVPRSMAQPPESHSVPSGLLCSLEASFCSSHLGGGQWHSVSRWRIIGLFSQSYF